MSTNKTPNYQLHSWEGGDHFLRAEMNENFTAIDEALGDKAEAAALTTHAANGVAHVTAAERTAWNGKQAALTFDASPTSGSSNPVKSGGVHTALAAKADSSTLTSHTGNTTVHITAAERTAWNGKQAALTFDASPTSGSNNPVKSGGVYTALNNHTGNTTVHITAAERTAWNAKVDVVFGSYTGTGSGTKTINLGFTPKAVILARDNGIFTYDTTNYGGMFCGPAVTGGYTTSGNFYVVQNGFAVRGDYEANSTGAHYYIAFK